MITSQLTTTYIVIVVKNRICNTAKKLTTNNNRWSQHHNTLTTDLLLYIYINYFHTAIVNRISSFKKINSRTISAPLTVHQAAGKHLPVFGTGGSNFYLFETHENNLRGFLDKSDSNGDLELIFPVDNLNYKYIFENKKYQTLRQTTDHISFL